MRKELQFPGCDESKIKYISELIDFIADNYEEDYQSELRELNLITGKEYDGSEFAEYWGWTSLDTISKKALTPNPPHIKDLKKDDIIEVIIIIKNLFKDIDEVKLDYYMELLSNSLALSDIIEYDFIEGRAEDIADKMLEDSENSIIYL